MVLSGFSFREVIGLGLAGFGDSPEDIPMCFHEQNGSKPS